jgi:hypothetical protein
LDAADIKTLYTDSLARHAHLIGNRPSSGAVYDPRVGTVYVPLELPKGRPNTFVENNVRHELGHGLDHLTDGSMSPGFRAAYLADLQAIQTQSHLGNPSLSQYVPGTYQDLSPAAAVDSAAREAFAQSFASATAAVNAPEYAVGTGSSRAKDFRTHFANTDRYMRQQFLPAFIAQQRQLQMQQRQAQPGQPQQGQPQQPQQQGQPGPKIIRQGPQQPQQQPGQLPRRRRP